MPPWWLRIRLTIKTILLPLIFLQFVRTLILPNPLDVFLLFVLFILFIGFLFAWY